MRQMMRSIINAEFLPGYPALLRRGMLAVMLSANLTEYAAHCRWPCIVSDPALSLTPYAASLHLVVIFCRIDARLEQRETLAIEREARRLFELGHVVDDKSIAAIGLGKHHIIRTAGRDPG